MAGKKILVCPEGSYVEDGVLTLPTTWDGDTFRLVDPYITIVSPQVFYLSTANNNKNWDGVIEYSHDTITWTVWDGTYNLYGEQEHPAMRSAEPYYLYFRGSQNTILAGAENKRWVFDGTNISIKGDIGWLLDYTTASDFKEAPMQQYCCAYLFKGNSNIIRAPSLVFGKASADCFLRMFENCTSLAEASSLPKSGLNYESCAHMYAGCTSLTKGVDMTYEQIPDACCNEMYAGCSSLVEAPALPSMNIGADCYSGMFRDCSALEYPPALPATTLSTGCYSHMFQNSGITTPPAMNIVNGANSALSYMFAECTNLVTAPDLNDIGYYLCCECTFAGCTNLLKVPSIHITMHSSNSAYACSYMFTNCTSITFGENSKIVIDGEYHHIERNSFEWMFSYCSSLNNPVMMYPSWDSCTVGLRAFENMFYECTSLETPPVLPPATSVGVWSYAYMFYGCVSLTSAPALPAVSIGHHCYYNMFNGCTSLSIAPTLPASNLAASCYSYMFYNCTSLVNAPALPASNLEEECYYYMFCRTGITLPPVARITRGAVKACKYMFSGCENLVSGITIDDAGYKECCYSMYANCKNLEYIPKISVIMKTKDDTTDSCREMFVRCSKLDFGENSRISVSGTSVIGIRCFQSMFEECSGLNTIRIDWPSWNECTVYDGAFNGMFSKCSSLTDVAVFPEGMTCVYSTGIQNPGYTFGGMFRECTSLVYPPELPINTLVEGCCQSMFSGCSSLIETPVFPNVSTIPKAAYRYMFSSCSSLTKVYAIKGTSVGIGGCSQMFYMCVNLRTPPALPATVLASSCYQSMFAYCGINALPALPATLLPQLCYSSMFAYCSYLQLSNSQGGIYVNTYSIPYGGGTATFETGATRDMFQGTEIVITASQNYVYTSNDIII